MTTTRPSVLFVCLHGSAKSLIAAEHFRRLAARRGVDVEAASAGLEPDTEIPPGVVDGLLADGIDVRGRRPRHLTAEDVARATHVVTFACDLGAPASDGRPRERWDDVPAVSEDYERARSVIVDRVSRLLMQLSRAART